MLNTKRNRLFTTALAIVVLCSFVACATISNKKRLITAHGVYNSQYSAYMAETGYELNDAGKWVKISDPELAPEQIEILRKKKQILTEMYPLIKAYDAMMRGIIPYSDVTEQELFYLIDKITRY